MPDLEKVVKGLDSCAKWMKENDGDACDNCPYHHSHFSYDDNDCYAALYNDAIALLKEQEARILDWDELEDWGNAVWLENDEYECYIALIAKVGTYYATFVNVEPGKFPRFDFLREFYKKEWCCWTAQPTNKQRKAVKWE